MIAKIVDLTSSGLVCERHFILLKSIEPRNPFWPINCRALFVVTSCDYRTA
jgi:hypothetical protein